MPMSTKEDMYKCDVCGQEQSIDARWYFDREQELQICWQCYLLARDLSKAMETIGDSDDIPEELGGKA